MKTREEKNEIIRRKNRIRKRRNTTHKKKNKIRKRKGKMILFLITIFIIVLIIYYPKYNTYLSSLNKGTLINMLTGKDELLTELSSIKNSLSKLYLTEEDEESVNKEIEKLEEDIKVKSNKEARELIDKLKSQINDISARNQISLEEEYNKINDEIIDNYTEEENKILNEYRNSYEEAYKNNNFLLAKDKLNEMKTYIDDTNKLANERRITEKYEENSNMDLSTREPFYIKDILIANKEYPLSENYAPGESYEARQAFEEMKYDAQLEGVYINAFSTYRSYWSQDRLYNNYVYEYGSEKADTFSARPGFSEHQTGLAFDIGGLDRNVWAKDDFRYTKEAKWLSENAYKYGFVLRYPEGKEWITGYQYESWHFRYIGVEDSINFKDSNLTLEEYVGLVNN